jgi:hypothetical protein
MVDNPAITLHPSRWSMQLRRRHTVPDAGAVPSRAMIDLLARDRKFPDRVRGGHSSVDRQCDEGLLCTD